MSVSLAFYLPCSRLAGQALLKKEGKLLLCTVIAPF